MSTKGGGVVFLARTPNQLADASRVAALLPGARFFDAARGTIVPEPPAPSPLGPWVRVTRQLGRCLRSARPRVVVLPQDVGLFERAAVASARRAGCRVALLPDGIVTTRPLDLGGTVGGPRRVIDRLLVRSGVLAGQRGRWGSSHPDLVLSAGDAWSEVWEALTPSAEVVVTGSPRADELADVSAAPGAGHVLVCSQPLWEVGLRKDDVASWYRWLTSVTGPHTRLRLHPRERSDDRVPAALRGLERPASLVDDLSWADVCVAPFSGVLLEAAVCGRAVGSIRPDALPESTVTGVPFLAADEVPKRCCSAVPRLADAGAADVSDLAGAHLAHVGDAARRVAEALAAVVH